MTERRSDDLTRALHRLRAQVRERVPAPASAEVRAAAARHTRVRRGAAAGVVAAAVAAIALGTAVWGPGDQPRHAAPAAPADPVAEIADVDWRTATIDLPAEPGCPRGRVTFAATGAGPYGEAMGPGTADAAAPRVYLQVGGVATGDLTGDGAAEAVLPAACGADAEDSLDGEGQLLVVAWDYGRLRALGWVGPRGAAYDQVWVDGGVLHATTTRPGPAQTTGPEGTLRFTWDGHRFVPA